MIAVSLWLGCSGGPEAPPAEPVGFLTLWGAHNDDAAGTIARLDDGDLLVSLSLAVPSRTDAVVLRLAPDGAERWETQWGREFDEDVHGTVVAEGTGRIGGAIWDSAAVNGADLRTLLIDVDLETGDLIANPWEWNPTGGLDVVRALVSDPLGVIGLGESSEDVLFVKLDDDAAVVDTATWDGGEIETIVGGTRADDTLFVVGQSKDPADQEDHGDLFVGAFGADDFGHRWSFEWGESFRSEERGFDVAANDSIVVALGLSAAGEGAVVALDRDGAMLWEQRWADVDHGQVAIDGDRILAVMEIGGDLTLAWLDPADGTVVEEVTWGGAPTVGVRQILADAQGLCIVGTATGGPDGADQALATCFASSPLTLPLPLP